MIVIVDTGRGSLQYNRMFSLLSGLAGNVASTVGSGVGSAAHTLGTGLDLSQSFLSGALDVIAVRQLDGGIRSTPFHVRIGKFNHRSGGEARVRVYVNGEPTCLVMRVSRDGKCYFVHLTPRAEETLASSRRDARPASGDGAAAAAAAAAAPFSRSGAATADTLSLRATPPPPAAAGEDSDGAVSLGHAAPPDDFACGSPLAPPPGVEELPELQADGAVTIRGRPVGRLGGGDDAWGEEGAAPPEAVLRRRLEQLQARPHPMRHHPISFFRFFRFSEMYQRDSSSDEGGDGGGGGGGGGRARARGRGRGGAGVAAAGGGARRGAAERSLAGAPPAAASAAASATAAPPPPALPLRARAGSASSQGSACSGGAVGSSASSELGKSSEFGSDCPAVGGGTTRSSNTAGGSSAHSSAGPATPRGGGSAPVSAPGSPRASAPAPPAGAGGGWLTRLWLGRAAAGPRGAAPGAGCGGAPPPAPGAAPAAATAAAPPPPLPTPSPPLLSGAIPRVNWTPSRAPAPPPPPPLAAAGPPPRALPRTRSSSALPTPAPREGAAFEDAGRRSPALRQRRASLSASPTPAAVPAAGLEEGAGGAARPPPPPPAPSPSPPRLARLPPPRAPPPATPISGGSSGGAAGRRTESSAPAPPRASAPAAAASAAAVAAAASRQLHASSSTMVAAAELAALELLLRQHGGGGGGAGGGGGGGGGRGLGLRASEPSSFLAVAGAALGVRQWEKYLTEGVHWSRSPTPTASQLASLRLREGPNALSLEVVPLGEAADEARPAAPAPGASLGVAARLYLWTPHDKIVVSDVDGTITKSDVLGHLFASIGRDWTHTGVARLYTHIRMQGYHLLYLTARAIGQAHATKDYLANIKQGAAGAAAGGGGGSGGGGALSAPPSPALGGAPTPAAPAPAPAHTFQLPGGPVFTSPDRFITALTREVISRTPHEFKIAALREVRALFPPDVNPFFAGFGNRDTDVVAYRAVGVPEGHIYLVNPAGELRQSGGAYCKSYTTIDGLLQEMFPAVAPLAPEGSRVGSRYGTPVALEPQYDDALYWRAPLAALSPEDVKAALGGGGGAAAQKTAPAGKAHAPAGKGGGR
jgi:hypothetical protein